jgi:hypothetical protein
MFPDGEAAVVAGPVSPTARAAPKKSSSSANQAPAGPTPACIALVQASLQAFENNFTQILGELRAAAGPETVIVVMTYYNPATELPAGRAGWVGRGGARGWPWCRGAQRSDPQDLDRERRRSGRHLRQARCGGSGRWDRLPASQRLGSSDHRRCVRRSFRRGRGAGGVGPTCRAAQPFRAGLRRRRHDPSTKAHR